MTGETHRAFSVTFALGGAALMTYLGRNEVNPLVATPVLLMASRYGAILPDVDHHWGSVPDKTTPNRIINGFIRLSGGKHRSWQTHSIDIYVIFVLIALLFPSSLLEPLGVPTVSVLTLLVYGVLLGWGSHLFSDMLTPAGVRLFCWSKFKLRFVPKWAMFATSSKWEDICYKTIKVINNVAGFAYVGWCIHLLGVIPSLQAIFKITGW